MSKKSTANPMQPAMMVRRASGESGSVPNADDFMTFSRRFLFGKRSGGPWLWPHRSWQKPPAGLVGLPGIDDRHLAAGEVIDVARRDCASPPCQRDCGD